MRRIATGKDLGGHSGRPTERIIAALLGQPTLEKAARACGLSKATVCRRLQEPQFRAEYRSARRQLLEVTISRLQDASTAAVAALRGALRVSAAGVRVTAARTILDFSMRGVELMDLEDRVIELEQRFGQKGDRP